MIKMIELVYRAYADKKDEIERGCITAEHINWVTDHLMLRNLTNTELSEMWEAVDRFFDDKLAIRDEAGRLMGWDPHKSFERDTESAWKDAINLEARRRNAEEIL